MMVPREGRGDGTRSSAAAFFIEYRREYNVGLKDGVTPDQFAAEAERLAHELAQATLAAKSIFKTSEIADQFTEIANHAAAAAAVLEKSPFVRWEIQHLAPGYLMEAWGGQTYPQGVDALSDEQRQTFEEEGAMIRHLFEAHPIVAVVTAIAEAAEAGRKGAQLHGPDTPEHRRETIRDETIVSHCAEAFERLTEYRAARASVDAGDRQEQAGRFPAFVYVVCDRIHEILTSEGVECERPHPSDRTLKRVIHERGA